MTKRYPMKEILDTSIPIIAEMTLYNLMIVFDMMMIGNYGGNKCLTAVGLSNGVIFTLCDVFISVGLAVSVTSLIARSIGSRHYKNAQQYSICGLFLGVIISFSISYFMFYKSEKILYIAGARGDILKIANVFNKTMAISIFFKMNTEIINSILRGYKNTKIPFFTAVIISSCKIILDFIFIFGIGKNGLGVFGAALASILSQIVGFIFSFIYMLDKLKSHGNINLFKLFKIDKIKDILNMYIPASLEEATYSVSRLLCAFMIIKIGSISFSANEIANTIETVSIIPSAALGVSATTLVGMKIGEKDYRGAKEYANKSVWFAVSISLIFSLLFIFMPNLLVGCFVGNKEKNVVKLATVCLLVGAIEQPFIAASTVVEDILKGMGDAKTPFIVTLISSWCIRVPLFYYYIYKLKYSVVYVWWITAFQWFIDFLLMKIILKKKFNKFKL
ncbi:MATE family efflux transporter [Clostridium botulinum]|nr:MATE family efflux transporter [Clostridium botulinum]APQ72649.1 MATE efflux family protein [Clostridium botulinum]AUM86519.1 MATE family efflux transporter [Clostridium botulinum]AUN09334.1 MATE family efflux transporter [Clostridium botulinum]AUN16481.1 MATE family efflux transporter [Clostridium botulinum]AUN20378.1 MATE family efflux transporter [Clostridium botulinum]